MAFSPETFLSNIKAKDGLAKPSRFEVILPIPVYIDSFITNSALEKLLNLPNTLITDITQAVNQVIGNKEDQTGSRNSNPAMSRYLALQCEAAELPGKTLLTADAKVYGPGFKVPYQTQYTDTTLTFLCTNEFYERKLFDRYLEAIMPTDTNNLRFPKGIGNDNIGTRYMTNIKIIQYDDFIKRIFIIELIDAFPISIASQQLSWQDDNFHRLSVQFAYQKYRVVYDGGYSLVQAATEYFGGKAARIFDRTGRNFSNNVAGVLNKIF